MAKRAKTLKIQHELAANQPDEFIAGLFVHHIPVPSSGKIIIDPYEEAARKQLSESEFKKLSEEDVGCSFNIWFPKPHSLCAVWNVKRAIETWNFAIENTKEMPQSVSAAWQRANKLGQFFFSLLSVPWSVRKFYSNDIKRRWNMKFISAHLITDYYTVANWVAGTKKLWNFYSSDQKPNKLGLPGGKISQWEVYYAGPASALRAVAREFLEEGKRHPVKLAYSSKVPDRGPDAFKHFFWVIETHDEWQPDPDNTGVKGETLPPIEIPIAELNPRNFYFSHAQGVITLLEQLAGGGLSEYQPSLDIMKEKFKQNTRIVQPAHIIPRTHETIKSYDDNVDFAEAMHREGVNPIA